MMIYWHDMTNLFILAPAMTRLRNAGLCGTAALAACRMSGRNRDAAGNFFGAGGLLLLETL